MMVVTKDQTYRSNNLVIATDASLSGVYRKGEQGRGPTLCAMIVEVNDIEVYKTVKTLGNHSISEAEYLGLIEALKWLNKNEYRTAIIYMDSQFIVRQMSGEYKVRSANIVPFYQQAKDLLRNLQNVLIVHHHREAPLASRVDGLMR